MAKFSDSEDIFDRSRSWEWRAVRASFGTTTGAILRATLRTQSKVGLAFGEYCDISKEGVSWTMVRYRKGEAYQWVALGDIKSIRDNFRHLADHCKFNDNESTAMFERLKKWIRKDDRSTSHGDFHGNART